MEALDVEPWVDKNTARYFLNQIVHLSEPGNEQSTAPRQIFTTPAFTAWVNTCEMAPLAYWALRQTMPVWAEQFREPYYAAGAESSLREAAIGAVSQAFLEKKLILVLLKGAALSMTVYPDPGLRLMSDIDIWMPGEQMPTAVQAMATLGYVTPENTERPLAMQQLFQGEIQFVQAQGLLGLVELHWSPFPGWWLMRTAAVDDSAIWQRLELVDRGNWQFFQMSPEDMVIHVAVHISVNHQFDLYTIRSLVDIALTAQQRDVDWPLVAERAKTWRVATAVYTVLNLADQLIGIDGLSQALSTWQPPSLRQRLLRQFVTPESILAGHDISAGWQRFMLLLLLVDRKRDMAKLILRTLWPEPAWLQARYGENIGHIKHIWRMIRRKKI